MDICRFKSIAFIQCGEKAKSLKAIGKGKREEGNIIMALASHSG